MSSPEPSTQTIDVPARPHFLPWLAFGWAWFGKRPQLGLVPVVATLIDVGTIAQVLAWNGVHVGLTFPIPTPVIDLWTVTNTNVGGGVQVGSPNAVLVVFLVAVVEGLLAAGYLASIDSLLDGDGIAPTGDVGRYAASIVAYNLLLAAVTQFFLGGLAAVSGALALVVGVPLLVVGGYLLYAAPFLVVVGDQSLVPAVRRSVALALDGGGYLRYLIGFLVGGAGISVLVTLVVVNLGLVGIGLGLLVAATVGPAMTVATVGFVRRLDAGGFESGTDDSAGTATGEVS